ncbi:MAG TPA: peptidylprolyl isomerase [Methanoregula sp.]|nr:peptidylprolyl isomerase [Methanoregula sp.]
MTRTQTVFIFALIACALLVSCGCTQTAGTQTTGQSPETTQATTPVSLDKVRLETTMGNITIALNPDMPITTGNFETLVKKGYYNGVIFHRVIPGFMIQGGDPTGTGRGGPGYTIPDEFTNHNRNNRGTVAMANTGYPDTGRSQFFINLVNNNHLDKKHPVFGTVIDGMDVVDAIANVPTGEKGRPLTNVTILHAEIV